MKKITKKIILLLKSKGFFGFLPDRLYLKLFYRIKMGKKLNLDNPQTYNEKIQWLKLNDRKDIYTTMVDKYEAKNYAADQIGEEYIVPTLGVWESFDDIDFEKLPEQFVLKCTHDSGGLVICRDKSNFDKKSAKKTINRCLRRDYYRASKEWPYKNVKPRIIAEIYMEDENDKELRDYKFFCFDGEVKALFIATERQEADETKFDFFDMEYNHLPFTNGHPNAKNIPQKPQNFEKMIELSKILSRNIPHVRVDFYEGNGKVFFGELTFYHWSGMTPFDPEEWDYTFGSWINIEKQGEYK